MSIFRRIECYHHRRLWGSSAALNVAFQSWRYGQDVPSAIFRTFLLSGRAPGAGNWKPENYLGPGAMFPRTPAKQRPILLVARVRRPNSNGPWGIPASVG